MLKIVGAVAIIVAFSAIGFLVAHHYTLRAQQLQMLQSAFGLLETEICYGLTPLPKAFDHIGKRTAEPLSSLLINVGEDLLFHRLTLTEAWRHFLQSLGRVSALKKNDLDCLWYFGQGLGEGDLAEEKKKFRLLSQQLQEQYQEAIQERDKNQRIWQYLGITLGIAAVLILI